jgi:hypothetical protein
MSNIIQGPWQDDPRWSEVQTLIREIGELETKMQELATADVWDPQVAIVSQQIRHRSERIWEVYQEHLRGLGKD